MKTHRFTFPGKTITKRRPPGTIPLRGSTGEDRDPTRLVSFKSRVVPLAAPDPPAQPSTVVSTVQLAPTAPLNPAIDYGPFGETEELLKVAPFVDWTSYRDVNDPFPVVPDPFGSYIDFVRVADRQVEESASTLRGRFIRDSISRTAGDQPVDPSFFKLLELDVPERLAKDAFPGTLVVCRLHHNFLHILVHN